jgi:hypothetical protein
MVVYWARKNGWLVLYVPDGKKQISWNLIVGEYWTNAVVPIEESVREAGYFDQQAVGIFILRFDIMYSLYKL